MKSKVLIGLFAMLFPVLLVGCTPMDVTIDAPPDGQHFGIGETIDLTVGFDAASTCTGGERCRPEMDWWIYIDGVEVCSGGIEDGNGSGLYPWCPATNVPGEYYCDFHWYIPASDLGMSRLGHTIEVVADPNNSCNNEGSDSITIHIP